jgi:hypothetical protein
LISGRKRAEERGGIDSTRPIRGYKEILLVVRLSLVLCHRRLLVKLQKRPVRHHRIEKSILGRDRQIGGS